MRPKRFFSALLAALLTAGLCASPAAAASFTDTEGHEAEEAIELFTRLEILRGDGEGHFLPDASITRGDLCTILDRVFIYTETAPNTFPDLDETKWYAQPMLRLNALGIILGDGDGIRPLDTIRWDEALVMIARAFGLEEQPEQELPWPAEPWAAGYIGAMYAAGYLPERELELTAPFTRADTVTVLDLVLADLGWEAAGKILFRSRLYPILPDVPVNGYDMEAFSEENGRFYYDDGVTPVHYGIDVSSFQNEVDWEAVAADGIEFVMIRLGFRGYTQGTMVEDKFFQQNIDAARAAGLNVGVYFFSQAITPEEGAEEARFVLEALKGREVDYPIVFDWEPYTNIPEARTNGLSGEMLTSCAIAFCETIKEAGLTPMVYFNTTQGYRDYDLSRLTDYPFWYALYGPKTPNFYYEFQMWQYSSTGSVAGIEGNVDLNICFGDWWHQDITPVKPPAEEEQTSGEESEAQQEEETPAALESEVTPEEAQ